MGTQALSQNSYTFDADTLLQDAVSISASQAGTVASVARVIDFGVTQSGTGIVNVAFTPFELVVDVRAVDSTTGDETYMFILQLSNDADADGTLFEAADVIVSRVILPFGDGAAGGAGGAAVTVANTDDLYALGRYTCGADNRYGPTLYRYARLFLVITGTTGIITPFVYLTRL
jgi:hypothetical protein